MNTTNSPVIIHTPEITPRLSYIVSVLFGENLQLIASEEAFLQCSGYRINYTAHSIKDTLQVIPCGLLSETGIRHREVVCSRWRELTTFFETDGDIPFDIFSASFYLLSRYEEYLPHEKDEYGRYAHTNSLAYRENFLGVPLVNHWLQALGHALQQAFPGLSSPLVQRGFRFLPTYDVDIAYAYRCQPIWKNVLGFYRDLLMARMDKVIERSQVYSGRKPDPFDTFSWLDELHAAYGLQPAYFFLTIIKRGEFDKNLKASSKGLQKLYRRLAASYTTGLHPSWQSGNDESLLFREKQVLENILQRQVCISRNHYLRFNLPQSYRRLIDAGITDDHSMAYGAVNGFRASYAMPFRWYDLSWEEATHLMIHPFCFMEAASFFNQGYTAAQAGEEMQYYHDTVKQVQGQFITLFHNHFLTEQPEWLDWRKMYEDFLEKNFGDRTVQDP